MITTLEIDELGWTGENDSESFQPTWVNWFGGTGYVESTAVKGACVKGMNRAVVLLGKVVSGSFAWKGHDRRMLNILVGALSDGAFRTIHWLRGFSNK